MPSISTTNARRRRKHRIAADRLAHDRMVALYGLSSDDDDCGQCKGTGRVGGGLSGDGEDEECPVCDGTGILPHADLV